ncbi:MAG: hypothetical protein ACJ735_12945 [Actinomycetes bacterium]
MSDVSPRPRAVVVRDARPGSELLSEAIRRVGLWDLLASVTRRRAPANVPVAIAAGMSSYDGTVGAVDHVLVERLVDELAQRGYTRVSVIGSRLDADSWLEPDGVTEPARALGYTGRTTTGTPYDIREPTVWADAAFRISVAANATHPQWGYRLTLANLLGIGEMVHVAVIDAVTSAHGVIAAQPIDTHTVIAATDAVLADVVGAQLMGLDPAVSPLTKAVLHEQRMRTPESIEGDLTPYPGWRNVPALLRDTLMTTTPSVRRVLVAAMTPVNRERYHVADTTLDGLNRLLTGLARAADTNPYALVGLVGLCGWAGAAGQLSESWATMLDKSRLKWRDTGIGIDLGAYTEADYDAVADYIEPLAALVDAAPADTWGMRRTSLDESVLFSCRRVLAARYDEFVARVDVASSIRLMNDYLGGATVAVSHDDLGRVTRQAERNIYLPQPNYLALFGGTPIDVCKLQTITYADDEQTICWRTVHSPNGSATYDDGSVRFRALDGGNQTEITIHARQQFTLPLFWQIVDLDRMPEVKDPLVADAYRSFFLATLDNFEACYEGREYRIGRPYDDAAALPTAKLTQLGEVAKEGAVTLRQRLGAGEREPDEVDEDGFRVFRDGRGNGQALDLGLRRRLAELRARIAPSLDEVVRDLRETVSYDTETWSSR